MAHDPDANAKAIAHLVSDLGVRFPTIPGAVISEHIERAVADLSTAQIHDFVPILVERRVRELLTSLADPALTKPA